VWSGQQSLPNNKRAASVSLAGTVPVLVKQARPLTKVLESLPPSGSGPGTGRAPAAYAAALQPLSTPPLQRYQSTPTVSAPTTSGIRSTNSFLAAFARRGSSVQAVASRGVKHEADAAAAAVAIALASAASSEERAMKRPRVADDAEVPWTPAVDSADSIGPPELSRQPTLLLARTPSPAIDAASPASRLLPSSSPEVPLVDDLFAETDIGVDYRSNASQRRLPADMDALELFYSDGADSSDDALVTSSLVDRAGTVLSPSTAAAALISAASSLGAEDSAADASAAAAPRVLTEDTLRRVIEKDDFKAMQVLGQFNLGFIIAKLNEDLSVAPSAGASSHRDEGAKLTSID
jgi:hypothetical protein